MKLKPPKEENRQGGSSSGTADPKPNNLNYTYYKWGGAKLDGEEGKAHQDKRKQKGKLISGFGGHRLWYGGNIYA